MYRILKGELNKVIKFKEKIFGYIQNLRSIVQKIPFDDDELSALLLSACRSNDFNVISRRGKKMFLNEDKILEWIKKKLLSNTVIVRLDDEDIMRLLIFCIEITYQMFEGGTKATVSARGFRERKRTFESILADQFTGKLGEIMVKKFLEENFPKIKIELDWRISKEINKHKNDIINAKKNVSIKSSPNLAGIWAEADIGYDYGITVKCSVPRHPILQFFIEVCGFTKLLNFAENRIPVNDDLFKNYLSEIRERIKKYKCERMQTYLKGIICGYFKTSDYKAIKKGEKLPYLGTVKEERYLVPINELKWTKDSWEEFLKDVELL